METYKIVKRNEMSGRHETACRGLRSYSYACELESELYEQMIQNGECEMRGQTPMGYFTIEEE